MPHVSRFYGITIWIYYDESPHPGRPHFHASYGAAEASFEIDSLTVLAGRLPPRARRMVLSWALQHQDELRENWRRARDHLPLKSIDPLP
jgi:uncharacterized protein DUF4160